MLQNIYNSIHKKFLGILLLLAIPFLIYSLIFAFYTKKELDNEVKNLSNIFAIQTTAFLASNAKQESSIYLLKALSTTDTKLINSYYQKFKQDNDEFYAYINALAWGSETNAFKNSSNGKNYLLWIQNKLTKSISIKESPYRLQLPSSYADLYFAGYVNHAEKIFNLLNNNKNRQQSIDIQDEIKKSTYFSEKVGLALSQLASTSNDLLYSTKIELLNLQYKIIIMNILSNLLLYLIIFILSWFFIKKVLVGPIIRLTNKVSLLGLGQSDIDVPIESHDEIGVLANQFNVLLQNINEVTVSKNYVGRILNSITNILITIGTDGKIESANSITYKLLHYTKEDIIGMNFEKLFTCRENSVCDSIKDILIKMHKKDTAKLCAIEPFFTNAETALLSKKGIPVPVLFSIMPICNEEGDISNLLCIVQDISKQKEVEKKLEHLAEHDVLTDLPNRNLFNLSLDMSIKRAERTNQIMALLYLDLDNFKGVNDTLGHDIGDLLLVETAKRLKSNIREDDIVARLGGDEFAIILNGLAEQKNAGNISQIINDSLAAPFKLGEHIINISTSIGIACYPTDGQDTVTLMKNADIALYSAKELGRNNYQYFTDKLNQERIEQMKIENDLQIGLKKNEFFLVYQPRYNLATRKITGVDTLLRWNHPKEGLIPPSKFIPIAESSNFIIPLGEWVLETACKEFVKSFLPLNPNLILSVNISPRQLFIPEFPTIVSSILDRTGVPPQNLEIDLTETAIIKHKDIAMRTLKKLDEMGIHIAIDNFGSAYATLDYLKEMPAKTIKIDRNFIKDIAVNPSSEAIVKSIITLAKTLNITTVAGGIETDEQLNFLCENKCPEAIGFFFSKPINLEEMKKLLEKK